MGRKRNFIETGFWSTQAKVENKKWKLNVDGVDKIMVPGGFGYL